MSIENRQNNLNKRCAGARMIKGSCLCGKVRYEIIGEIGDIIHCHCQTCRKAHGSAFSSVAAVNDSDFHLSGRECLSFYESSKGKRRYFCSGCGTQIYAKKQATEHIILRLGSLDSKALARELKHIWVSQKAEWYSINQELPMCEEFE